MLSLFRDYLLIVRKLTLDETHYQCDTLALDQTVVVLETNLDDVTAEVIGYTKNKLMAAGALDVFTTPIQMKKDRPAVILSVICRPTDVDRLEKIVFDETSTLGIRRNLVQRSKQARREHAVETPWGPVQGNLGWRHGQAAVFSPEFEDCARIATEHEITLREVYRAAESGFQPHEAPAADLEQHDHDHDHDH